MTSRVDPDTRRAMLTAIFDVAIAAQDDANGIVLDTAGWIARGKLVEELAAVAEDALQRALVARAALTGPVADHGIDLAAVQPAGRA